MKKNKNIHGIFLHKFLKKNISFWIQQFYFERIQKYLWKCCYTIKKPLKNRAIEKYKKGRATIIIDRYIFITLIAVKLRSLYIITVSKILKINICSFNLVNIKIQNLTF
jgi:hypothetical protein